ncbi:tetratricopeptide repeat protein [bacterium]|nr:tetratricopeptide repeat protein [bacterium]QQR58605.1 MAG: tetratricopeptide repeat protein [Candidatus Melainabacteria bacterium]
MKSSTVILMALFSFLLVQTGHCLVLAKTKTKPIIEKKKVPVAISRKSIVKPLPQWQKTRNESHKEIYDNGNLLRGIEKLEQSISEAKTANADPKEILTLYRLYLIYTGRAKNFDDAIKAYEGVIEYAEKAGKIELRDDTLITLAFFESDMHHYDKSIIYAQKAIDNVTKNRGEHFPGLIRAYELLGSTQLKMGNLTAAKENLTKSLALSNSTFANNFQGSVGLDFYGLGLIAEKEGDKTKALEWFQKAKAKSEEIIHRSAVLTKANGVKVSLNSEGYLNRVDEEINPVEREFIYKNLELDIARIQGLEKSEE